VPVFFPKCVVLIPCLKSRSVLYSLVIVVYIFMCIYFINIVEIVGVIKQNAQNPVEDLRRTPGSLALSNMMYFAKNYSENYTKVNNID